MIKYLFFGRGEITKRLVFRTWWWDLYFKIQDLWIGVYWNTTGHALDVWICLIPCFPLHFCFLWLDPEQSECQTTTEHRTTKEQAIQNLIDPNDPTYIGEWE